MSGIAIGEPLKVLGYEVALFKPIFSFSFFEQVISQAIPQLIIFKNDFFDIMDSFGEEYGHGSD